MLDIQDALSLLERHEARDAARLLEQLVAEMPAYAAAQVMLARSYEALGESERAVAVWREALRIMPSSAVIRQGLQHATSSSASRRGRVFAGDASESERTRLRAQDVPAPTHLPPEPQADPIPAAPLGADSAAGEDARSEQAPAVDERGRGHDVSARGETQSEGEVPALGEPLREDDPPALGETQREDEVSAPLGAAREDDASVLGESLLEDEVPAAEGPPRDDEPEAPRDDEPQAPRETVRWEAGPASDEAARSRDEAARSRHAPPLDEAGHSEAAARTPDEAAHSHPARTPHEAAHSLPARPPDEAAHSHEARPPDKATHSHEVPPPHEAPHSHAAPPPHEAADPREQELQPEAPGDFSELHNVKDTGTPHYEDLDRIIRELESARIVPRPDLDNVPSPDLEDDIEDVVSETLARIYASQGQYDEAARVYELLAGQHPEDADEYLQEASKMRSRASDGE